MLQPLDVCVNKPFKGWLRTNWSEYISDEARRVDDARRSGDISAKIKPPPKQLVVDWITSAVDKLRQKPDLIQNSFVVTGIAPAINGADDHRIRQDASACDSEFESDDEFDFAGFTSEEIATTSSEVAYYSDEDA